MTTSTPETPPQKKKTSALAVRTSPRILEGKAKRDKRVVGAGKGKVARAGKGKVLVGAGKGKVLVDAGKGKVSKESVTPDKTLKVKPRKLGRGGGSKKGSKVTTPPVEEEVEEDDDDEEDVDAGGADDNDDDDFQVEDDNEEDEDEDSDDSAPDQMVESEADEDDDSSDEEEIARTATRRGTPTSSFSKRNVQEQKNSRRNKVGEKRGGLARKPRSSTVVDPTDCQTASKSARSSESSGVDLDQIQLVHAYTRKESALYREPHVTSRVKSFVKSVMFRKVKFVNNELMIQKAMQSLFKFENVKEHKKLNFHRIYESVFNDALNTKRSACEQAGGKIVKAFLKTMADDEYWYTIEELCKLRRSTTEREVQAFYWFFSQFLECVCGKKAWGSAKYNSLVSKASFSGSTAGKKRAKYTAILFLKLALNDANDATPGKIVTVSDEAFALLTYENYVAKWIRAAKEEEEEATKAGQDDQKKNKAAERKRGLYTGASIKSGQCKMGGWSRDGMVRFNELFAMVKEDRASPQASMMEQKLLEFCKTMQPKDGDGAEDQGAEDAARKQAAFEPPVEAMWDDDDIDIEEI